MTERTWNPATGLPFQIPGARRSNVAVLTLTREDFIRGLLMLESYCRIPKAGPPRDVYYDMVKYELTRDEWMKAVRAAIFQGVSRMPSPAAAIELADPRRYDDRDPHAGHWIFYCPGCDHKFITREPMDDPPERCGACRKEDAWARG